MTDAVRTALAELVAATDPNGDTPADGWKSAWRKARAALSEQPPSEPDMRHPKIQALIGSNARRSIELSLVEQLLEDQNCDLTALDMEYWNGLHDKLLERLTAAHPAPVERVTLSEEDIRHCANVAHGRGPNTVDTLSDFSIAFARAVIAEYERANGIGTSAEVCRASQVGPDKWVCDCGGPPCIPSGIGNGGAV